VHRGTASDLALWLDAAATSASASFTRGRAADRAAVAAAMTEPWSTGPTEGQINRPKTLKRQMYGRANIKLRKPFLKAAP
jgi:transposase